MNSIQLYVSIFDQVTYKQQKRIAHSSGTREVQDQGASSCVSAKSSLCAL